MKVTIMSRLKTLSYPIASLLALSAAAPIHAQNTYFSVGTHKTFRQAAGQKAHNFRGGSLELIFRDGLVVFQSGCISDEFFRPTIGCPLGSNGFTTFTSFGSEPDPFPYISVLSVTPAFLTEPTQPDRPHLYAAPFSKLPRPLYGFADAGLGLFYDLFNPSSLQEYKVARYDFSREYGFGEYSQMNLETVPGSYFFSFPKLGDVSKSVNLSGTIRNLPDGLSRVNSVFTGVNFDTGIGFDSDGFMIVNFNRPTTFRWSGFDQTLINANTDRLYFSLRFLSDPTDPLSETTTTLVDPITGEVVITPPPLGTGQPVSPASLFPGFVSGSDPRIKLANPFVTSFTIPPIFRIGSAGVVELELNRSLSNSSVVFDTSSRRYQIPIRFGSYYSDYAQRSFGSNGRKVGIEEDFDGDSFDNLTEWVLNSRAQDARSTPALLRPPALVAAVVDFFGIPIREGYFGFKIPNAQGYVPGIIKTLERSTSTGTTPDVWREMVSDANWDVIYTDTTIELLSKTRTTGLIPVPTQPPGTAGHKYRLRVTLAPTAP